MRAGARGRRAGDSHVRGQRLRGDGRAGGRLPAAVPRRVRERPRGFVPARMPARGHGPVPTRHVAGRAHADRQARGAPVPAPPGPAAPRRPGRCRVAGDCLAALSAAESAEVAYDGPGAGPRPGERLRARAQAARRGCLGPRAGQPGVPQEGRDAGAPRDPRARAGLLGEAPRTSQGAGLPRPDAPRGQHRPLRASGARPQGTSSRPMAPRGRAATEDPLLPSHLSATIATAIPEAIAAAGHSRDAGHGDCARTPCEVRARRTPDG